MTDPTDPGPTDPGPTDPGLDRYQLQERIATGGMGEVWRAQDTVLHRAVAVKVLKGEYADDPRFRERFEIEARHAASLHHPNIATVFDFGEERPSDGGSPRPYLVMELVDGRPLSQLIRPGVPMPPDRARAILGQAADALAAAHAAGIVHRDVKPANLMVTAAGQVKVTDFGIARAADQVALTGTGEVIGTPHYLSPEQATGKVATPASDVYALGVVLYECLTGTRPFAGESPVTTALAHIREPLPELPADLPPDLARITRRALAKDPAARYVDAGAMASALRGDTAEQPTAGAATRVMAATTALPAVPPVSVPVDPAPTPTPTPAPASTQRDHPRSGTGAWLVLVAVALLAAVVIVVLALNRSDDPGTGTPSTGPSSSPSTTTNASPSASASDSASDSASASQSAVPTHSIDSGDFVGLAGAEATSKLHDLGYAKVYSTSRDNPGGQEPGTVAAISPTGDVPESTPISLTVWGQPPSSSPAPTSPTSSGNQPGPGPDKAQKQKTQQKSGHVKQHGKGKNPT